MLKNYKKIKVWFILFVLAVFTVIACDPGSCPLFGPHCE